MERAVRVEVVPGVKQGAFFDLEKTLTAHAAEQTCALAMARKGRFPVSALGRVLLVYLKYNLGLISNFEEMKRFGAKVFQGRHFEEDRKLVDALFSEQLQQAIYPEARALVGEFQARGVDVYIVSSTYRFVIEPYAKHLGIRRIYGADLELDGERCTGNIRGTIYHQAAKAAVLEEAARVEGVALEHSWAFGDSINDAPMLEKVGHPVAVNPASALRKLARARGWTVARWSLGKR